MRTHAGVTQPPLTLVGADDGPPSVEFDALAELFLGDDDRVHSHSLRPPPSPAAFPFRDAAPAPLTVGRASPSAGPRPGVEALILGHLPVFAGPWAAQYVAAAAEREGAPITLVRLSAGWVSVETFGEHSRRPFAADSAASPPPSSPEPAAPSLEHAIERAAQTASRWVIRADATDEMAIARAGCVDTVTILSGADEAAIVAGYRTIKGLTQSLARSPGAADRPAPALRVAIMGAPREKARSAAARLREAAEAFLEQPVEEAEPIARIGPLHPTRLFHAATEASAEGVIRLIADSLDGPAAPLPRGHIGTERASPARHAAPAPTRHPVQGSSPSSDYSDRAESAGENVKSALDLGRTEAPTALSSAVLLRAAPVTPCEAGAALAAALPGFTPLSLRCPYDESVELAVGPDGSLHVLARAGDRAVEALTAVAQWARDHAAILALACPMRSAPGNADRPVRHLFADRASSVRRLLDTDLRLHLLTPVAFDGATRWVSADLND